MLSFESQLAEAKLTADFTPDQQVFLDQIIAEFLERYRDVKDADLIARFRNGEREALIIYREMLAKREQILDFINNKEDRNDLESKFNETIRPGDTVYYMHEGRYVKFNVISDNTQNVTIESVDLRTDVPTVVLDVSKDDLLKESELDISTNGETKYLKISSYDGISTGEHYKSEEYNNDLIVRGFCMNSFNELCVVVISVGFSLVWLIKIDRFKRSSTLINK